MLYFDFPGGSISTVARRVSFAQFTCFNLVCLLKFTNFNKHEILFDCDQSNVLLARIIFSCSFLNAFSFLSTYIRDPGSI